MGQGNDVGETILRAVARDGPYPVPYFTACRPEHFIAALAGDQEELEPGAERPTHLVASSPEQIDLVVVQEPVARLAEGRAPCILAGVGLQPLELWHSPTVKSTQALVDTTALSQGRVPWIAIAYILNQRGDLCARYAVGHSVAKARHQELGSDPLNLAGAALMTADCSLDVLIPKKLEHEPTRESRAVLLGGAGRAFSVVDVNQDRPRLLPRIGKPKVLLVGPDRDVAIAIADSLAQNEGLSAGSSDPDPQAGNDIVEPLLLALDGRDKRANLCVGEADFLGAYLRSIQGPKSPLP